jgi:ethanolamine permease
VTIYFQLQDPVFRTGVLGVAIWFSIGVAYFAAVGRRRLILSPEEEFAMEHRGGV